MQNGLRKPGQLDRNINIRSLAYFFPSFPQEINKTNIRNFLAALSDIGSENPAQWQYITDQLVALWEQYVHPFKLKYIVQKDVAELPPDQRAEYDRLYEEGNKLFSSIFKGLLNCTYPNA